MNDEATVDTPEQAEFRAYCREWLSNNKPGPPLPPEKRRSKTVPGRTSQEMQDYQLAWQKSAYEGGLVGCDYPKEYGGGGRTDCQRVANQEMQRIGVPEFPGPAALSHGAPTLLVHASEFLKKRFIPKMLSGEEQWCQGFSEPNAGSDVANQETFAEKRGDSWVVNGQKIWTSEAHWADWILLVTRTDRSHKHKGITYFVAPMKENLGKTVEVRPLVQITGEAHFNEVFFTDLTIPDEYRVDEVGKGWSVVMTELKYERGAGDFVQPLGGGYPASDKPGSAPVETPIVGLAKRTTRLGKAAADDPVVRDRIMQILIRQAGFEQANRRGQVKGLLDHPMRIAMQHKLVSSELYQDLAALSADIAGAPSTLSGSSAAGYISSLGGTILAGTSEIQRNQLGERILGMPKTK